MYVCVGWIRGSNNTQRDRRDSSRGRQLDGFGQRTDHTFFLNDTCSKAVCCR